MSEVRLQKFLARSGIASRRASEKLIEDGRVCVNGVAVTELGTKVDPESDLVEVDGRKVEPSVEQVTIMLNKPAGYMTTMSDPQGRPTVAELVPIDRYPSLYPVGRLDNNTTGLLLFTTDGELGHALLHPRKHVFKRYVAEVEGRLEESDCRALSEGIRLRDGMTLPARVELLSAGEKASCVAIEIQEGRNRQVRRMLSAVGHPVKKLRRTSIGPLELGALEVGSWRILTEEEVALLR